MGTAPGTVAGLALSGFFAGKRVLVTGHTGFKGSWLCLWLHTLGATVAGYALDPPTAPSLFELARVADLLERDIRADVLDRQRLAAAMAEVSPEIVIHLAAQSLVRASYLDPVGTYATNVMGTVHLLEAVRGCPSVRAVVNVTSDKCYAGRADGQGCREDDPLGGDDPYASSKGCAELVTAAYRQAFFPPAEYHRHGVAVATARAGNVIGGGDWAADRLVPDLLRAIGRGEPARIRNPQAIRPWQHVLEPLAGYLLLARELCRQGPAVGEGWNFGPAEEDHRSVAWVVRELCALWGEAAGDLPDEGVHPPEAAVLRLDCRKAAERLGWAPRWDLRTALVATVAWAKEFTAGSDPRQLCLEQLARYQAAPGRREMVA